MSPEYIFVGGKNKKNVLHKSRYLTDPLFVVPGLQQHVGKMLHELERMYHALNNLQSTHTHNMKYDQIFKQCSGVALIWHALKCWWQKVNGALTTAGSSPFPRRLASSRKRKSLKRKKKNPTRDPRDQMPWSQSTSRHMYHRIT